MGRFAAFADSALQARLERLTRAEVDLQQRIQTRVAQVEAERRWVLSDPIYQRLSSSLREVRRELAETRDEHLRRSGAAARRALAA